MLDYMLTHNLHLIVPLAIALGWQTRGIWDAWRVVRANARKAAIVCRECGWSGLRPDGSHMHWCECSRFDDA